MEAGDSGSRQSGFASLNRPDFLKSYARDVADKPGRDTHNMAAATLLSPASTYNHGHALPPYAQAPPSQSHTISSIITQHGSRRASNESEATAHRQSLPSISEVFSNVKSSPYSPTTPTTMGSSQGIPPPPFSSSSIPPRIEPSHKNRLGHAQEDKFPRFPQRIDGPPTAHASSSYAYSESRENGNAPERNVDHSATLRSSRIPYPQSAQLPAGQMPLPPAPPLSPRHVGHSAPLYDHQRPQSHRSPDDEFGTPRRYDSGNLNRHFEAWGVTDSFSRVSNPSERPLGEVQHLIEFTQQIAAHSRTLSSFAEAYHNSALEQHGGPPIPERLPGLNEVQQMLSLLKHTKELLENVRDVVQHNAMERAREGKQPSYDDDDGSVYGDGTKPQYSLGEPKKRRGRAAPPGRCHSCNRVDTPEWRRGPDGARTLCNACGLHFAKLERKKAQEARSIRPKGE